MVQRFRINSEWEQARQPNPTRSKKEEEAERIFTKITVPALEAETGNVNYVKPGFTISFDCSAIRNYRATIDLVFNLT
jgi:hypothetical protein